MWDTEELLLCRISCETKKPLRQCRVCVKMADEVFLETSFPVPHEDPIDSLQMTESMCRKVMHFMVPDVCKFASPKFFLCTSLYLSRATKCVKFSRIYKFLYTVPFVY